MPKQIVPRFGPVNANNINTLKKLNTVCLPVNYNKKFYEKVQNSNENLCKLGTREKKNDVVAFFFSADVQHLTHIYIYSIFQRNNNRFNM